MKGFITVGLNVHFADNVGKLTPANTKVYKNESEILKDADNLTVPEGFAGLTILPVLHIVDVKAPAAPKAKPEPKAPAAPKVEDKKAVA